MCRWDRNFAQLVTDRVLSLVSGFKKIKNHNTACTCQHTFSIGKVESASIESTLASTNGIGLGLGRFRIVNYLRRICKYQSVKVLKCEVQVSNVIDFMQKYSAMEYNTFQTNIYSKKHLKTKNIHVPIDSYYLGNICSSL